MGDYCLVETLDPLGRRFPGSLGNDRFITNETIHKADFLRYLLLCEQSGVYTNLDTKCAKTVHPTLPIDDHGETGASDDEKGRRECHREASGLGKRRCNVYDWTTSKSFGLLAGPETSNPSCIHRSRLQRPSGAHRSGQRSDKG